MNIFVSARPGTKEDNVEKIDETHFKVSVKEPPIRGRANKAITALLAEYFDVPASCVVIVRGNAYKRENN